LRSDLLAGNVFYLYGFAAVAIFILLIACINYMNLATARATKPFAPSSPSSPPNAVGRSSCTAIGSAPRL